MIANRAYRSGDVMFIEARTWDSGSRVGHCVIICMNDDDTVDSLYI